MKWLGRSQSMNWKMASYIIGFPLHLHLFHKCIFQELLPPLSSLLMKYEYSMRFALVLSALLCISKSGCNRLWQMLFYIIGLKSLFDAVNVYDLERDEIICHDKVHFEMFLKCSHLLQQWGHFIIMEYAFGVSGCVGGVKSYPLIVLQNHNKCPRNIVFLFWVCFFFAM